MRRSWSSEEVGAQKKSVVRSWCSEGQTKLVVRRNVIRKKFVVRRSWLSEEVAWQKKLVVRSWWSEELGC